MLALLKRVIVEKEFEFIIDDDHPKKDECKKLVTAICKSTSPDQADKYLSVAYSLKPKYFNGVLEFRTEDIKNKPVGFLNEISIHSLPNNVIESAYYIYYCLEKVIKKQGPRKCLFFYCIYHAYLSLEIPCIPELLADKIFSEFTIKERRSKMQSSVNLISPMKFGLAIPVKFPSPQYYTKLILEEMGVSTVFEESINKYLTTLLAKYPDAFDQHKPHYVCYVTIKRFIKSNMIQATNSFQFYPPKKPIEVIKAILTEYDNIVR